MRVESGKQSNHTSFIVPAELGDIKCGSLRNYVSEWLLLQDDYVCCVQIAHAFGISQRQASNIIYNIHCRHSELYDCSTKKIKHGKGNVAKTWIMLNEVRNNKRENGRKKTTERSAGISHEETKRLSAFFLKRNVGESLAVL